MGIVGSSVASSVGLTIPSPQSTWPDATNSGYVYTGVTLTVLSSVPATGQAQLNALPGLSGKTTWDGTNLKFTASGTVATPLILAGFEVRGRIDYNGQSNITVKRCWVHSHGDVDSAWFQAIVVNSSPAASTGTILADSTVSIDNDDGTGAFCCIQAETLAVQRCELTGWTMGVRVVNPGPGSITDSWIHADATYSGVHADGVRFGGNDNNYTVRHNSIELSANSGTAPILIGQFVAGTDAAGYGMDNLTIDNNRLRMIAGGGGFLYYGGTGGATLVGAVRCTNNVFDMTSGDYTNSAVTAVAWPPGTVGQAGFGSTWSNNRYFGGSLSGHLINPNGTDGGL